MDNELEQIGKEPKIYEVGFHILPTVGDENLGAKVTEVRDAIDAAGGKVFADEYPKHIELSYPMVKVFANKRTTYNSSYFGWMKFDADPKVVKLLDETLKKDPNVLRYIIVETVRESTMSPKKFVRERKMRDESAPVVERVKEEKPAMTEEELDKTIEELVIS